MYYIYKIVPNDTNIKECFIGSTKNLDKKMKEHKNNYYNYYNQYKRNGVYYPMLCHPKLYKSMRENGGWTAWKVEIIRTYSDNTAKHKLLRKKRRYMYEYGATLNRHNLSIKPKEKPIKYKESSRVIITENHIILLFS